MGTRRKRFDDGGGLMLLLAGSRTRRRQSERERDERLDCCAIKSFAELLCAVVASTYLVSAARRSPTCCVFLQVDLARPRDLRRPRGRSTRGT